MIVPGSLPGGAYQGLTIEKQVPNAEKNLHLNVKRMIYKEKFKKEGMKIPFYLLTYKNCVKSGRLLLSRFFHVLVLRPLFFFLMFV